MESLILVFGPHNICNFNCPYCFNVAGKNRSIYTMFDKHHEDDWIVSLKKLNRRIKFFVSGIGEPILLRRFRDFAKELSCQSWFDSMLIFTNGSRIDLLKEFEEYHSKIKFQASYHPTEISKDKFISTIKHLQASRQLNHVSVVAYKYHFLERIARQTLNAFFHAKKSYKYNLHKFNVHSMRQFIEDLAQIDISVTIQGIDAIIPPYKEYEKTLIASTRWPEERPYLFRETISRPNGVLCECGKTVLICDHTGNLWRCSQYINSVNRLISSGTHGNIFENAMIDEVATPCKSKWCSISREEYAMRKDNQLSADKVFNIMNLAS